MECVYGCDRIWKFDRANYLIVIFTFSTAGRELIERDMLAFESPCFIIRYWIEVNNEIQRYQIK